MWIDLLAGRLVFPKGGAAAWLDAVVDPFEVAQSDAGGPYASAFWRAEAEAATRDGLDLGPSDPAPVRDLLAGAGLVVRGDVVTVKASFPDGDDATLGLALGVLSGFARAAAHGARGALLELGVQPAYSDDAFELAHGVAPGRVTEASLDPERALDLRESAAALDPAAFDPAAYPDDEEPA